MGGADGRSVMTTYYFDLKTDARLINDPVGMELADEAAAREHARAVARELMRHRESKSRHWRLCVHRGGGEPCFDVLFASVDQTMDAFDENLRRSLEIVSGNIASLSDAIDDLHVTLRQVKATMARADDQLHLAAIDGVRL